MLGADRAGEWTCDTAPLLTVDGGKVGALLAELEPLLGPLP